MDLNLALVCSQACRMSYDGEPDTLKSFLDLECIHSKSIGDLFAVIGHHDKCNWIVLRGTATIGAWMFNLNFIHETHPLFPGTVHTGFADAWDELYPWLKQHLDINKMTYITGHSLGGAIATLANHVFPNSVAYTFGSPRVGSLGFAKNYNAVLHRFVCGHDLITKVPNMNYWHVGNEYRVSKYNLLWSIMTHGIIGTSLRMLQDHKIHSYVDCLADLNSKHGG